MMCNIYKIITFLLKVVSIKKKIAVSSQKMQQVTQIVLKNEFPK